MGVSERQPQELRPGEVRLMAEVGATLGSGAETPVLYAGEPTDFGLAWFRYKELIGSILA